MAPAAATGTDDNIDEQLATMGGYLKSVQTATRTYLGGWTLLNLGLAGYFAYDAMQKPHERAVRASNIMLATISCVNTAIMLAKPMPGANAWRKYKKMPEDTLEEKRAKLDAGARWLSEQIAADDDATKPEEHVLAALVGIGFGAGLLFGYEDGLRPAVQTTLGIILIAELQFATRPHRTRRYAMDFAAKETKPAVELSFVPMFSPTSRGLGLVGRF